MINKENNLRITTHNNDQININVTVSLGREDHSMPRFSL